MSTHSLFSPSAAHRWIACPGSMAFPENQEQGGSSTFADDGTASHEWAALCLTNGQDPSFCGEDPAPECFLGEAKEINGESYVMDETRASFCQIYLDDVRRRAIGGSLFVEYKVDLFNYLGKGQGGTADAVIDQPGTKTLTIEDLKYGTGEKVYAENNPQLLLYALGMLADVELMGHSVEEVTLVICQPRLGHIDEWTLSVADLLMFALTARSAVRHALEGYTIAKGTGLNPGVKQCRWCRAKAKCPALTKYVTDSVRCDFETIEALPPTAPRDTAKLSAAYIAVPLIEDWCRAVRSELGKLGTDGEKVIGPDGKPYKLVEGKGGSRAWTDAQAAEALLVGQLGPKADPPQKATTRPEAAKLLDTKKTKALWQDVFEPLIKKAPGKPVLALGSDERPPYSGAADANDFE